VTVLGKVRIGKVKGVSNEIVNKYGSAFSTDFNINKKLVYQYSDIRSKHLNNRVAGYITRLLVSRQKREEALKLEEAEIASQENVAASEVEVPVTLSEGSESKEMSEETKGGAATEATDDAENAEEGESDVEEEAGKETAAVQSEESATLPVKPSEDKK
jgi:small subunit ribosomal protein S17e